MGNLTSKLISLIENEKPIELSKDEVECLIKLIELGAKIDLLEFLPKNKEQACEEYKKEFEELFKVHHLEGFEELKNYFYRPS